MGKFIIFITGIACAMVAIALIKLGPPSMQPTQIGPPLQPIVSTSTPSPTGDCWNDAAGPGCAIKVPHPRGPGECGPNSDECPWRTPTPSNVYTSLFPTSLPVPCPACEPIPATPVVTPTPPTPWPGQHKGETLIGYKTNPFITCDPYIPGYDPRICYGDSLIPGGPFAAGPSSGAPTYPGNPYIMPGYGKR
jgi:hypothetical protein